MDELLKVEDELEGTFGGGGDALERLRAARTPLGPPPSPPVVTIPDDDGPHTAAMDDEDPDSSDEDLEAEIQQVFEERRNAPSGDAHPWAVRPLSHGRSTDLTPDERKRLNMEARVAKKAGIPWSERGPEPGQDGERPQFWRGQKFRTGKFGGKTGYKNRGGKWRKYYDDLNKAGGLIPTPKGAVRASASSSSSGNAWASGSASGNAWTSATAEASGSGEARSTASTWDSSWYDAGPDHAFERDYN